MIIYNTTYHIEYEVCDDFMDFIRKVYIPQAVNSGFLHQPRFARIYAQYEEKGCSYSLQFHVKNLDTLNHWLSIDGKLLHDELVSIFENKAMGFVTLLEELEI